MRARLIAVTILPLVFLAVVGCTKKPTKSSALEHNGTAASSHSTAPAGGTPGSVTLKPVGGASPSNAGTAGSTAAIEGGPIAGTSRLLELRAGSPVFPSDYDIGALQPLLPAGTERGAIVRVVRTFFEELAGGKVDTSLLSPEWKDEIERQLSGPKKTGNLPSNVRIGILSVEQDKAHAAIRMEKGAGSASGEIYLDRIEGAWYVSDIQADFADLGKPAAKGPPFDPAEWKSMIKE